MVWRCTVVLPPPLLLLAMLNIATSTAAAARALTGSGRGGAHGPTLGPVVATHAQEGVPLFTKGDMGYDSFRGTVLLQEPGTPWLVAFACGRKGGGDASGRTRFLRRSSDGGQSWDRPRVWARASNASLRAGDGVYMGSAVYDTRTKTSMILWGECLEACAGQHGNPRRSNETVWAAPSFMMTRSSDHFATWTQENLTAINDPEVFPQNTYGYGLQDQATGELLFCGPYTMRGAAGCMVSADGGHRFKPLAQVSPPASLQEHSWSEQQMARITPLGSQDLIMIGHGHGSTADSSDYLVSFSRTFGRNWSMPSRLPVLRQPGCQGSVASSGTLVMVSHPNNGTGYLPGNHDPARNHMTISYSRSGWLDGWQHWKLHLVYAGFSGYSAMQDLSVGRDAQQAVGLIYERGEERFDEDVWVAVVPFSELV